MSWSDAPRRRSWLAVVLGAVLIIGLMVPASAVAATVLADSYSEIYRQDQLDVAVYGPTGQTLLSGASGTLDSCQFMLYRVGPVVGDVYAQLWEHTGTFGSGGKPTGQALATSSAVDVTTISDSWQTVTFAFDNSVSLESGTPYVITVDYPTGGSGALFVGLDWGGFMLHPGQGIYTTTPETWNVGTAEVIFSVFVNNTHTLTYTAGSGGMITGDSPQTVNHGSSGTEVTAVPNAGYHFVSWSDGGLSASRTDTNVTADKGVTATFALNTYTLTYTAGSGGTITGVSPQTVNHGSSGTEVTAVPNAGYRFVSWSDGKTANPRTDANATGNVNVTASFAATGGGGGGVVTYTLTYTAGTGGTIGGTSPQTVNQGGSGTAVTAVPSTGYHFVSWSDGKTDNPRTDSNVTGSGNVSASFALNTYTLTYSVGAGGTMFGTSPQTVAHNGSGTAVTAVPHTGYHFVSWSDGKTANPRTDASVTGNVNVTAAFALNPPDMRTLTYLAGPGGSIEGSATQVVSDGSSGTTVTAVPGGGYHFTGWSDGVLTPGRADAKVTADVSVTANFALDTVTPPSKARLTRTTSWKTLYRNRTYHAKGYIRPYHRVSDSNKIKIRAYKKGSDGKYRYVKSFTASYVYLSKSRTAYKAPIKFKKYSSRGKWKLVAYHATDSANYKTYGSADYVTVK